MPTPDAPIIDYQNRHLPAYGRAGMVVSPEKLAGEIGLDMLKQGGNAIDAAIAANAALGLMEPTGNGMGGDLFAIVWDAKTEKLYGLNASGRSPRSLTLDEFKKRGGSEVWTDRAHMGPLISPLSVPLAPCMP